MLDAREDSAKDSAARVAELEAQLATERAALAAERAENERLRDAYHRLRVELELIRRRLFVAQRERVDTSQLELEFGHKLAELDALNRKLGLGGEETGAGDEAGAAGAGTSTGTGPGRDRAKRRPTGRRDLREEDLPVERIEVPDPELEGGTDPIAWEESSQVRWRRGSFVVPAARTPFFRRAPADVSLMA